MSVTLIIRICVCVFVFGFCLCAFIDKQNEVTKCKIAIPKIQKEIAKISQRNQKLMFMVDRFESPSNLLKLAKLPEYSYLHYPFQKDVFSIEEGYAVVSPIEENELRCNFKPSVSLAIRMGH